MGILFFHRGNTVNVARVKTDGTDFHEKQLEIGTIGNLYVTGGWIYFANQKLTADFTESSELICLITDTIVSTSPTYSGDYVYFLSSRDYHYYKMKIDGTRLEDIYGVTLNASTCIIYTDKYVVTRTKYGLGLRNRQTGEGITDKLLDVEKEYFIVDGDNVYCILSNDNQLIKRNVVTGETSRFGVYTTQIVGLVDDYIYYYNYDMGGKLYRIKTDGTGNEAV